MDIRVPLDVPKFKKYGPLPQQPSKLIRVALKDFAKVERSARFKINMQNWVYKKNGKPCEVCLAGAVMVGTLKQPVPRKLDKDEEFSLLPDGGSWNIQPPETPALMALNCLREGNIRQGFIEMGLDFPEHFLSSVKIPDYTKKNRVKFRAAMNELADALEKEGY